MAAINAFYAQSGGATAVINATACGLIEEARRQHRADPTRIGQVYAGRDGILCRQIHWKPAMPVRPGRRACA